MGDPTAGGAGGPPSLAAEIGSGAPGDPRGLAAEIGGRAEPGRVAIDIDGLGQLIRHVKDAERTLREEAPKIRRALDGVDLATRPATTLLQAAAWAEDEIPVLERRLSLAEGIENDLPPLLRTGTVTMGDGLAGFRTPAEATAAGRELAEGFRDEAGNPALDDAKLAELGRHSNDPDFLRGFFDTLGPRGLAWVAGDTYPDGGLGRPGYDRDNAQTILGTAFAAYTQLRTIDNTWLGQLNHYPDGSGATTPDPRSTTSFENEVLAGLLPHGTYDAGFLELLGDRMYGARQGEVSDAGWGYTYGGGQPPNTGPGGPALAPTTYQTVVLRAITTDPTIAARFADRHLDRILADSRNTPAGADPSAPGLGGALATLELARVNLLRAGTMAPTWYQGTTGETAPPSVIRDAETLVAHIAFNTHANAGAHVSTPMQALYGEILHTYRDDMYHSVTSLTPETFALADERGRPVSEWPGSAGLWAGPANAGRPGVEIPQDLWSALLQEALRNGTTVGTLIQDGFDASQAFGPATLAATQNPGVARSFPDRDQEHLDPADLDQFRSEKIAEFLGLAVEGTVRSLEDEAAQWRRDSLTGITNLSNVLGETGKAFSPGKSVDIAATVIKSMVEILKARARGSAPGNDDLPAEIRGALSALQGQPVESLWAKTWRDQAVKMWDARSADPIESVRVNDPANPALARVYTGDPVEDGFVTGPSNDFMDTGPNGQRVIKDPLDMTATQRQAFERWLASPAVVANNRGGRRVIFGDG